MGNLSRFATPSRETTFILRSRPWERTPFQLWLQIMIAEAGSRRKGIAREALLIMMAHAHDRLVRLSHTACTYHATAAIYAD